ncbi:hypothetical protein R5R35_013509 [Gryllus longicercus]|uniref:Peptidase M20 dimerisation domain-containing protein n=1 Tax=Gryllus longicercus TaxID=2509291 RepID=A0AAN9Z098_9ORTH
MDRNGRGRCSTDPFRLTEYEGALWGRGASASKGPALCWLHVLEAFKQRGDEPPVNLRLIFDTAAEVGSPGLPSLLRERRRALLRDVEFVCATVGQRVGKRLCACHAARGLCYFHLTVAGAERDAHSGACGGVMHEPLGDLLFLLDSLHGKGGRIAVPELLEDVVQATADEETSYSRMELEMEDMRRHAGNANLLSGESKTRLLMQRWRMPTITLHGIEGAFSEPGGRPVIPRAVVGKFSVRLVPNQRCERVARGVRRHVAAAWQQRASPNSMTLHLTAAVEPWIESAGTKHFQASLRALKLVAPVVEPETGRLGGAVPGAPVLQALTGRSVVVLPLGGARDTARGHNEHITLFDYMQGHRIVAAYMQEIANMK